MSDVENKIDEDSSHGSEDEEELLRNFDQEPKNIVESGTLPKKSSDRYLLAYSSYKKWPSMRVVANINNINFVKSIIRSTFGWGARKIVYDTRPERWMPWPVFIDALGFASASNPAGQKIHLSGHVS